MDIWKGFLLWMHHKLQGLFSHLRAVLGLDTLVGYQLGSQRLLDHKAGHSLGLLCNTPTVEQAVWALATGGSM